MFVGLAHPAKARPLFPPSCKNRHTKAKMSILANYLSSLRLPVDVVIQCDNPRSPAMSVSLRSHNHQSHVHTSVSLSPPNSSRNINRWEGSKAVDQNSGSPLQPRRNHSLDLDDDEDSNYGDIVPPLTCSATARWQTATEMAIPQKAPLFPERKVSDSVTGSGSSSSSHMFVDDDLVAIFFPGTSLSSSSSSTSTASLSSQNSLTASQAALWRSTSVGSNYRRL